MDPIATPVKTCLRKLISTGRSEDANSPDMAEHLRSLVEETGLLSNEESAAYLGVSPGTLETWRCTKRYLIPYIKIGRLVRYRKSSLDNFLSSRTVEG